MWFSNSSRLLRQIATDWPRHLRVSLLLSTIPTPLFYHILILYFSQLFASFYLYVVLLDKLMFLLLVNNHPYIYACFSTPGICELSRTLSHSVVSIIKIHSSLPSFCFFSLVYMARDCRTGEIVALKKIRMDNEKQGVFSLNL